MNARLMPGGSSFSTGSNLRPLLSDQRKPPWLGTAIVRSRPWGNLVKNRIPVTLAAAAALCAYAQAQATPSFAHFTYNGAYSYTHADLNGDGREDLVFPHDTSSGQNAGFGVVLSTGDHAYGTETDYVVPDGQASGVVTLDINNDGKPDIIAYNTAAPGFYEYLNNGNGTFHLQATIQQASVYDVVVGDFNHDGYADLAYTVVPYNQPWTLQVRFNNHASGFTLGPKTAVPEVAGLTVGDFDGDGKADIFASGQDGNPTNPYIYFGDNTGHFPAVVSAATSHGPSVFAMDIDGDGRTDLVGASEVWYTADGPPTLVRKLYVIYGNASRTITESSIPLEGYAEPWRYVTNQQVSPNVDVADFNGDGKQDIALVEVQNSDGTGARNLVVLTGKGNRQWNPELKIYSNSELDFGVAAIRDNMDAKPDLLVDTLNAYTHTTTAQFFVNDTYGGYYGGCALPNVAYAIRVCSPTTYSSTTAQFSASAAGEPIMRKMEIWIDGVKRHEQLAKRDFSHYAHLNTTLNLSAGTHKVAIYAAGYDNMLEKKVYSITVK